MEQRKKYPVGIQTFEEIVKGGYYYADKTDLIYKLVQEGKYYFISRPRRFGKSLLVTTLEAYFEGKKDLFKGLAIEQLEKDWESYPVFHLDFSGESYTAPGRVSDRIEAYLSQWETLYGTDSSERGFGNRMRGVLIRARKKTGKQAVILIDEYDKPLTDTIGNPEMQNQNREILQSLYGVLKNADANIRFAFLTGVTRYGKLGIFSANNNPNDISMVPAYSSICGITEVELHGDLDLDVAILAVSLKLTKETTYQVLKRKYDGYHFSERSEDVYNPFSVLKALDNQRIVNHWFATGTPSYLARLLKKNDFNLTLLEGAVKVSEESLASFGTGESNVVAALYQSGYLTIKQYNGDYYVLGFPNEEVASGFSKYLVPEFSDTPSGKFDPEIIDLRELVLKGDANGVMEQIQGIMAEIPFENNEPKMLEAHFRNMVYLMLRSTGYPTHVEMPKLGGRIDVCLETEKYAYIIECKRDTSAADALTQIDEKRYAQRLSLSNRQLFKVGANFSTSDKNLKEWKVG